MAMRNRLASIIAIVAAIDGACISGAAAQSAPSLDYDFFKSRVEPVFLKKRAGHTRCYVCHGEGSNNAFKLEKLPAGEKSWSEDQSRRNFAAVSNLVTAGDPATSRLLMQPLRARSRRQCLPFRRPAIRLQAGPGLSGPRSMGQRSEARGPVEEVADGLTPSGITSVLIRFGTSPTGTVATSFMALVSMTDTDRRAALDTYRSLLSGVNVTQLGTAAMGPRPGSRSSGRATCPISFKSSSA